MGFRLNFSLQNQSNEPCMAHFFHRQHAASSPAEAFKGNGRVLPSNSVIEARNMRKSWEFMGNNGGFSWDFMGHRCQNHPEFEHD